MCHCYCTDSTRPLTLFKNVPHLCYRLAAGRFDLPSVVVCKSGGKARGSEGNADAVSGRNETVIRLVRRGGGAENLSLAPIRSAVQAFQEYATHSRSLHWRITLHTRLKMLTAIIEYWNRTNT